MACSDHKFTLPDFLEANTIHLSQLSESLIKALGSDPFFMYMKKVIIHCINADALLINTVEEIDKLGLNYFKRLNKAGVFAIGPRHESSTPSWRWK